MAKMITPYDKESARGEDYVLFLYDTKSSFVYSFSPVQFFLGDMLMKRPSELESIVDSRYGKGTSEEVIHNMSLRSMEGSKKAWRLSGDHFFREAVIRGNRAEAEIDTKANKARRRSKKKGRPHEHMVQINYPFLRGNELPNFDPQSTTDQFRINKLRLGQFSHRHIDYALTMLLDQLDRNTHNFKLMSKMPKGKPFIPIRANQIENYNDKLTEVIVEKYIEKKSHLEINKELIHEPIFTQYIKKKAQDGYVRIGVITTKGEQTKLSGLKKKMVAELKKQEGFNYINHQIEFKGTAFETITPRYARKKDGREESLTFIDTLNGPLLIYRDNYGSFTGITTENVWPKKTKNPLDISSVSSLDELRSTGPAFRSRDDYTMKESDTKLFIPKEARQDYLKYIKDTIEDINRQADTSINLKLI